MKTKDTILDIIGLLALIMCPILSYYESKRIESAVTNFLGLIQGIVSSFLGKNRKKKQKKESGDEQVHTKDLE